MTQLLTLPEVARLARVHPETVRRMCAQGKFPQPIRIGHSLRWSPAIIEQFLAGQPMVSIPMRVGSFISQPMLGGSNAAQIESAVRQ